MHRALKPIVCLLLALLPTFPALGQQDSGVIPEKRVIVERGMDYYGADLRTLFDTTYKACRTACLVDSDCGAFTFNSRSNSCFPKRQVSRREPYEGALSAIVIPTADDVLEIGRARAADLSFLRPDDLRAARSEAEALPMRHFAGGWSLDNLLKGAQEARQRGDNITAMRRAGAAITLSDQGARWLDYANAALLAKGDSKAKTRDFRNRALPASINAYVRAPNPKAQANALWVMATALEQAKRGRDMIPALRLAQSLSPSPEVSAALSNAIGKYGFRVTDHQIDSNSAVPRVCVSFSEPLAEGVDFDPYIKLPATSFSVEAQETQLCVDGLEHGKRYQMTFRAGLPSQSGEGLVKDVPVSVYVRDRSPSVRFPGRAYVLPRTPDAALPIVTVNLSEVELALRRVSDRNLMQMIQDDLFGRPLTTWEEQRFRTSLAEEVWTGTGAVDDALNRDMTTLLPMSEAIDGLPAGLYALQAKIRGADPYDQPAATQWFVISDIGLASMSGTDGLHVFARSLGSADPLDGLEVSLMSRSNRVLGTATTDARGYAVFEPGLTQGRGAASPALLVARQNTDDMGFLPLTDSEFDLSDRGVEGRPAAGPVDVFLATDRGAYRAGETIHATALARDAQASAISGLPLTAVLTRPDGVEYTRLVSNSDVAGGHVFALPVGGAVPRGTWSLAIHADPDAPALVTRTLLVEDFLPERVDFELSLPDTPIRLTDTPPLRIEAKYLFGAPGSDLPIEGEVQLRAADGLKGFPGYSFGLYDEPFDTVLEVLPTARTDADGGAILPVEFPPIAGTSHPVEALVSVSVAEGSGRPVERRLTRALEPSGPMIGIKPLFDGTIGEGTEAQFQLIGTGPDMSPAPMRVKWKLNRIETRYQWYSLYGNWEWEPITRRERVASGEVAIVDAPVSVAAPVNWGHYELVVERIDGQPAASSVDFYAGWYAPADASASPDILDVSLDRETYRPGETAQLRMVPRYAGKVLVTVVSNHLIDMQTVDVSAEETHVDLQVTDAWGAGAYVTATLIRPMDVSAGHNPARALGLAHAAVDPGKRKLSASFEVPETAQPREPLDNVLKVTGGVQGERAYATIAAVDQGILNLTGFQPPDASAHYFGQRKLGVGMRDVYGRLIDGLNGAPGQIRSGGDASAEMRMQSPPPTEQLVAYFSGPIEVDAEGNAQTGFELPAFNGQIKLMAVVWSDSSVGEAQAEVLVRDPVVMTASLPRFLAPGDTSQMLLELVHADGPAGAFGLEVSATGVEISTAGLPEAVELNRNGRSVLNVPVRAHQEGLAKIRLVLSTPNGKELAKTLSLPIQVNDPEIATTSRFTLAPGDSFSLTSDVFAGLRSGTGTATVALGPLGRLDTPGLLQALDRYPYGCTEQVASQALPLLYLSDVATAMGLGQRETVSLRIDQAIDKVLSRQSNAGGFGLWQPFDGDFWLDAYVTDFLSRARAKGHAVPDRAFTQALDNLRNQLNYAADFDEGGEALAYALLVLAREGAASIGDLRYYADVKGGDFGSPLATAQIGAALALYGDQPRADAMFRQAAAQLLPQLGDESDQVWRADYGTNLRDTAGVLTLAVESGSQAVDRHALTDLVAARNRSRSTQESVWSLLAAHALVETPGGDGFTIDGEPADAPVVTVNASDTDSPVVITNTSAQDQPLTLTTIGVPDQPEPQQSYGYAIERSYYTMDGEPTDPSVVARGTRLVTVLSVTPFGKSEARLMVDDPLPAGLEIDNPSLVKSGDIRALDWLKTADTRHAEFRQERFLAAVDWRSEDPFRLAYVVRAISPGSYHHPAASVEDMYRPQFRGRSSEGQITVTE